MAQPNPLQELACTHCGSPIRTDAKPGTQVTCEHCGSAFLIPEHKPSAGIVIGAGATIHGDVVAGDKIVAKDGDVIIAGKDAKAVLGETPPDDAAKEEKDEEDK